MSAREMRNLLLEYRSRSWSEDWYVEPVQFPLANIPGHSYTIGSLYPGEREGEEFIFCRGYKSGLISPSHCTISVDDQGQYWIQDYTTNPNSPKRSFSFYETFVNSERVEASGSRLLKSGDIISLGAPGEEWTEHGPHPVYYVSKVKERATRSNHNLHLQIEEEAKNEECVEGGPKDDEAESPFDNDLIMSYLPFRDVKNARLVSKKWKRGASDVLEKKGQVSFHFGVHYINPEQSTRVFRYLKEMMGLKPRNVHIYLTTSDQFHTSPDPSLGQDPLLFSPGEPGDKMMNDLRKLLNSSHNFSNVFLSCRTIDDSAAHPFSLILQHLGEKLVKLDLEGDLKFLPEAMPPLPVLSNLKQLAQDETLKLKIDQKCVSFLVPLFAQSLEYFSFFADEGNDQVDHYLQEFVKREMPNLREIHIICGYGQREISETSLSHLLQLRTPLTDLEIPYKKYRSELGDGWTLLENLLFKNSSSLKHLTMEISDEDENKEIEIKFPPFPKLEELDLTYSAAPSKMRITWKSGDLDYKKHFPSLRKLKIINKFSRSFLSYADEDDHVFNSFFPQGGGGSVVGVKEAHLLAVKARPRMDRIRETFPNAVLSFKSGYEEENN